MDMLSIFLSRIQMGFTLGVHILFPTLNIGLALFICIMEALWLKTANPLYLKICKFWTKIFALAFGMGVVSGVVMAYQLGTNFGNFTQAVGEVLGTLFVYEVLTAFFLEAGFLGIMLFGWNRISHKMHFLATSMVAFGTILSAFWILAANSWMQMPSGFAMTPEGKFVVKSWIDAIFNPTLMPRFIHMILATFVSASFFIGGISAYYLLKKRDLELAQACFSFVLWGTLLLVPLQIYVGDVVGLNVFKYQPLKTAAIEGVWDTQRGAPLILFAWPDETQEKNLYEISIPYGASLINTHTLDGELIGLKSVPQADRPVVPGTFWGFRVMVGIGLYFLLLTVVGLFLRRSEKIYTSRLFLLGWILAIPLGFIATIAGWLTAELGRQPWVVYNFMRTEKGASDVASIHVAISLMTFIVIYTFVIGFFLYYLYKFIQKGPQLALDHREEEVPMISYMLPEHKEAD